MLRKVKDVLRKFLFEKWWFTIGLIWFSSALLSQLFLNTNSDFLYVANGLYGISLGLLIVAIVWQLIKGKWYFALIQFFTGAGSVFAVTILFLAISILFPDPLTEELSIPEKIKYSEIIELPFPNKRETHVVVKFDSVYPVFVLYQSFQPGVFQYDINFNPKSDGLVYLKIFEITNNTTLSTSSIKENTLIPVSVNNGYARFGLETDFKVYEGGFDKPYGFRFEVWFIPNNGLKEYKITESNYIIEGWMH